MRILELQNNPLWHQKSFSIRLEIPHAKRILVWYDNGNSKPWWLRTRRSYRFRRWSWLKEPFIFRSIANKNTTGIILWIFTDWLKLPEKIFVPLNTGNLSISPPNMAPGSFNIMTKTRMEARHYSIATHPGSINFKNFLPEYRRPNFIETDFQVNNIEEPVLKSFNNLNQ